MAGGASRSIGRMASHTYLGGNRLAFVDIGRLGFGGGYFDRTLAQSPRPRAVGIAYAFAKVSFEAEAHDIPLDVILTD